MSKGKEVKYFLRKAFYSFLTFCSTTLQTQSMVLCMYKSLSVALVLLLLCWPQHRDPPCRSSWWRCSMLISVDDDRSCLIKASSSFHRYCSKNQCTRVTCFAVVTAGGGARQPILRGRQHGIAFNHDTPTCSLRPVCR